ncbi:phage virion morphogenesis protein [Bradyrhizobium elkanii]|uniref:phage virion morphogenesis protein n=1 Tax=Bradyrhizobium elkanii TaxID=29448 RepID=UPI0035195803
MRPASSSVASTLATSTTTAFQVVSDAKYSSYVQDGVKNSRGKYKKKTTPHSPARPFMGFSAENARRISKMIRDHLKAT